MPERKAATPDGFQSVMEVMLFRTSEIIFVRHFDIGSRHGHIQVSVSLVNHHDGAGFVVANDERPKSKIYFCGYR